MIKTLTVYQRIQCKVTLALMRHLATLMFNLFFTCTEEEEEQVGEVHRATIAAVIALSDAIEK